MENLFVQFGTRINERRIDVEELLLGRSVFTAQTQFSVFSNEVELIKVRGEPWERHFAEPGANLQCLEGTGGNHVVTTDQISDFDQQRYEIKECVTSDPQTATAHDIDPFQHSEDIGRLANRDIDPHN